MDINFVIQLILDMAKESVVKNLTRSETVLQILKSLGIETKPATNEFETLYTYTLIEYGIYKPKPILEFFRNEFIKEAFRHSFYENDPSIIQLEANNIVEWNNETKELGYIDYDPRQELDEFSSKFRSIVSQARTPLDAEQYTKIVEIHNTLDHVKEVVENLKSETTTAQQIARDKPKYWEFLFTLELLRTRLAETRREFSDLRRGLVFRKSKILTGLEFSNWGQGMMNDLTSIIHILKIATTEELTISWGPLGKPGDPIEIQRAVNKIATACNELLEWEAEIRFTKFPEPFDNIKDLFQGWAQKYLDEIEKIPLEIGHIISAEREGTYHINLVFEEPSNIQDVNGAIENLLAKY